MTPKDALVRNAADPEQVKAGKREENHRVTEELEDLRQVLETGYGRRVLWGLLEWCGVFESSWAPSAAIHYNEGRRAVGLKIMADITQADSEALLDMMRENQKKKK